MKYINESTGYFARRYSSPLRRILKAATPLRNRFPRTVTKRDRVCYNARECEPPSSPLLLQIR